MNFVTIHVPGVPQPQGSKSQSTTGHMYESNKNLEPWRKKVRAAAAEAMEGADPWDCPCWMYIIFVFPRPKSHFNSKGQVKAGKPGYKESKPDLDKLVRAIGDSLSGVVVVDDARFVHIRATKQYTDRFPSFFREPCVRISVRNVP